MRGPHQWLGPPTVPGHNLEHGWLPDDSARTRRLSCRYRGRHLAWCPNRYVMVFRELAEMYEDEKAFARLVDERGDAGAHEVPDVRPASSGDMIIGVPRMEPGRLGQEFYMTPGHIHVRPNRPDLYRGGAGHGGCRSNRPMARPVTLRSAPAPSALFRHSGFTGSSMWAMTCWL